MANYTFLNYTFLFSGASAVGKTSILKYLIPLLSDRGIKPAICKIDCLKTDDGDTYKALGLPCVVGLSKAICPDHFLVSNLPELWKWCDETKCDALIIETAGLCHRCSPATKSMIAGCVLDCTSSYKSPEQLGPMLSEADFIVITKIDMVSQAELEIISWQIQKLNPKAILFPVDALAGYGIDLLADWLSEMEKQNFETDTLRHTMPSGICSYCIGEKRVGEPYQQGVVDKIDF